MGFLGPRSSSPWEAPFEMPRCSWPSGGSCGCARRSSSSDHVHMQTNRYSEYGAPAQDVGAGASGLAGRRLGLWSGLVLVIICAVYASHVRLAELSVWKTDPEQYVASGVPMMTTMDAYYSLR